jgi:hypothetical protein
MQSCEVRWRGDESDCADRDSWAPEIERNLSGIVVGPTPRSRPVRSFPSHNQGRASALELLLWSEPRAVLLLCQRDVPLGAREQFVERDDLGLIEVSAIQPDPAVPGDYHHAFLHWPPAKLAALPVQIYPPVVVGPPAPADGAERPAYSTPSSSPEQFVGAIGLQLTASGIVELGRIVHDPSDGCSPPILRSIVIGNTLFTLSHGGVVASSIDTLAPQAFAAFPQQSTPTVGGQAEPSLRAEPLSRPLDTVALSAEPPVVGAN